MREPLRTNWGTLGVIAMALVLSALLIGLALWFTKDKPEAPAAPAATAPAIATVAKETVTPAAPIKVYAKPAAKRLKLPKDVQESTTERVVAATTVTASERPQTVTTTIDTATGESRQFVRVEPFPWVALESRGEVRLSLGYKFDNHHTTVKPVTRLSVSHDVLRVKGFTAGVAASVDSDGDGFAGVGIAYRW